MLVARDATETPMTLTTQNPIERLPVNEEFALAADPAAIDRAAQALRNRGFEVLIAADQADARRLVLGLIPEGAEVHQGASATLGQLGITDALEAAGDYNAIRPITRSMDRATQMREIRKLGSAPDVFVNSVNGVTEEGQMVFASASGSQIGPIASGAGRVILVVGAQKVVPDLATAMRRLDEYVFPLVDVQAQQAYGRHSAMNKVLIVNGDYPGRTTVVLVEEPVGF
jgi:hypothetical protein